MTRTIATLIAATALVGCSSDAQSIIEPASYASIDRAPNAPVPEFELDGAPARQDFSPAPEAAPRIEAARSSSCDIIVKRTSHGVLIKAVANLSRSTAGDYSFVITKSGGGGSSDINQGGPFDGRAGRVDLGASEISLERGSSYRATLKLTSNGRELCRRQVRS